MPVDDDDDSLAFGDAPRFNPIIFIIYQGYNIILLYCCIKITYNINIVVQ